MYQTLLQIFSSMSSGLKYHWFLFCSRLGFRYSFSLVDDNSKCYRHFRHRFRRVDEKNTAKLIVTKQLEYFVLHTPFCAIIYGIVVEYEPAAKQKTTRDVSKRAAVRVVCDDAVGCWCGWILTLLTWHQASVCPSISQVVQLARDTSRVSHKQLDDISCIRPSWPCMTRLHGVSVVAGKAATWVNWRRHSVIAANWRIHVSP